MVSPPKQTFKQTLFYSLIIIALYIEVNVCLIILVILACFSPAYFFSLYFVCEYIESEANQNQFNFLVGLCAHTWPIKLILIYIAKKFLRLREMEKWVYQ